MEMEGKGIYEALCKVMEDVAPIRKEKEMNGGKVRYNFRGIDDVYNAMQPLLAKHGVFIIPEALERHVTSIANGNLKVAQRMRYHFCHRDGSSVSCEVVGEANDAADKGTNKAMSVAHKYALFQMFCIPTDEMPDPDGEYIGNGKAEERLAKQPQRERQERPARQATREDAGKDNLGELRTQFFNYLKDAFNGNLRRAYSDLSDFFGRDVTYIQDMSENEMRLYMKAKQEA